MEILEKYWNQITTVLGWLTAGAVFIFKREKAETGRLDDHERRIAHLESQLAQIKAEQKNTADLLRKIDTKSTLIIATLELKLDTKLPKIDP